MILLRLFPRPRHPPHRSANPLGNRLYRPTLPNPSRPPNLPSPPQAVVGAALHTSSVYIAQHKFNLTQNVGAGGLHPPGVHPSSANRPTNSPCHRNDRPTNRDRAAQAPKTQNGEPGSSPFCYFSYGRGITGRADDSALLNIRCRRFRTAKAVFNFQSAIVARCSYSPSKQFRCYSDFYAHRSRIASPKNPPPYLLDLRSLAILS